MMKWTMRNVPAPFSNIVRGFGMLALLQPYQSKRQQAAQFGPTFGRRHLVGRERVGAFHVMGLGSVVSFDLYSPASKTVPANPAMVEESRHGT